MSGTIQASVLKDSASSTNNLALDSSGNVTVGNNLTVSGTGNTSFSGNVGIGGAASVKLEVYGETRISGGVASGAILSLTSSSTGASGTTIESTYYTGSYGPLIFKTGGSERMRIDSSGNVGIGTTSPTAKLDVRGTAVVLNNPAGTSNDSVGVNVTTFSSGTPYWSYITNNASHFEWQVYNVERMRIDTSGNLLVGQTGTGIQNANGWDFNRNGQAYFNHVSGSASGLGYALFSYNATQIGSITQAGTTAVLFNTTSDYRLKENVAPITTGLATIGALKPVSYDWVSDKSKGEGFIAHELQAVVPLAVTGEKDAVNEDGSIKPQGVDYSKIVVHLVAALQEAVAKIDALETRITQLESK